VVNDPPQVTIDDQSVTVYESLCSEWLFDSPAPSRAPVRPESPPTEWSVMTDDRTEQRSAFRDAVNMSPKELEHWLTTEESKSVGDSDDGESTGHASGRRIVEIKRKNVDELTDDDYDHMNKVVGYVHRHVAQRPDGDVTDTRWRWSLMNWGHDPLA
jgi:hypothetical protein